MCLAILKLKTFLRKGDTQSELIHKIMQFIAYS